jgi:hypothetical protein
MIMATAMGKERITATSRRPSKPMGSIRRGKVMININIAKRLLLNVRAVGP